VVARLCLILSILLAGDSTLPNGIRVLELSGSVDGGNSFELFVGYRTSGLQDVAGSRAMMEVVDAFLKSTSSVRAMEVAAYGAGGKVEYLSDLDRTGLRLKMPVWAGPMVETAIVDFLSETPEKNPALMDRALEDVRSRLPSSSDVRSQVEKQFQIAMLGSSAQGNPAMVSREMAAGFFAKYYGTNRAFVAVNSASLKSLQSVERRTSDDPVTKTESASRLSVSEALPRVASDLDEGAVILGAPTPSVYYRNWFAFLMLDRLIQNTLPSKPRTELLPSLAPYFYRAEVAVPSGMTAEAAEDSLRAGLNQMQYTRATDEQLEAARSSALQYLNGERVQGWFSSLSISERRLEGIDWIHSFTADDMRAAARDLIESKPVAAGWSPKVRTLKLETELLSDIAKRLSNTPSVAAPKLAPLDPVKKAPFPSHTDASFPEKGPVQLDSGVSLVVSTKYAVYVAPNSPNSLTIYSQEPGSDALQATYGAIRAGRILVMAPPDAFDRLRQQWQRFKGNAGDTTIMVIDGKVPGPHLPALLALKMLLDRRLIEEGLWSDVQIEIRAAKGSTLSIAGSETNRRRVLGWIEEIASRSVPEEDADWAREAAIHHVADVLPDLQSLIWEWTPDGIVFDFHLIPTALIQDAARIYLQ